MRVFLPDQPTLRSPSGPNFRRAITLVEVLVVISTIGLTGSIILPAVLQARGSARTTACKNNLRQIGIAIHNFEASNRKYPNLFFGVVDRAPESFSMWCVSPTAQLAAFLDEPAATKAINDARTPPLWDLRDLAIPSPAVIQCPADGLITRSGVSYRYNRGVIPVHPEDPLGVFTGFRGRRSGEITDGLSNTAFVSERLVSDVRFQEQSRTPMEITSTHSGNIGQGCISENQLGGTNNSVADSWGSNWLSSESRHATYYHFFPPNSIWKDCESAAMHPDSVPSARSLHNAGVNTLFGDGRVEFVGNSIDLDAWRALGTRSAADHEP
ncbi:MAG: DUF1559 domain-containing protein [Planctomycetota bacterium]